MPVFDINSMRESNVALVTPFQEDERRSISYERLVELVSFHAQSGTRSIISCGTTGESPTLSHDEHKAVIQAT
jgi:4-hydroxy-tetrahydrodipicolinate synthase